MYKVLFIFICTIHVAYAQTPDSLIRELRTINSTSSGMLLSNRALNIFLSESAGYYMSATDNLSLYKNSVIANSAEGTLAIYHNLRQASGIDQPVRSFLSIGAQANVADAFVAHSENRPYNNQFGFLIKQTWVGRSHVIATTDQIQSMNGVRAAIFHSLETDIHNRAVDFTFDVDLPKEFEFNYAHMQSAHVRKTAKYKVIAFNWTSISLYTPLITENFQTIPFVGADSVTQHAYPLNFNISHTRLWDGSSFGKLFVTLSADVLLNNSRDGYQLVKVDNLHIGDYKSFITPSVKGQIVYLPTNSHFGISFLLEQAIGDYHAMNGILGVPIVLINKKTEPAINFEFQVRFYDMTHNISPHSGLPGRTAIGVTVGIPFSKIAY